MAKFLALFVGFSSKAMPHKFSIPITLIDTRQYCRLFRRNTLVIFGTISCNRGPLLPLFLKLVRDCDDECERSPSCLFQSLDLEDIPLPLRFRQPHRKELRCYSSKGLESEKSSFSFSI